eukprot:697152-Prymnesium_polylepis.1
MAVLLPGAWPPRPALLRGSFAVYVGDKDFSRDRARLYLGSSATVAPPRCISYHTHSPAARPTFTRQLSPAFNSTNHMIRLRSLHTHTQQSTAHKNVPWVQDPNGDMPPGRCPFSPRITL